MKEAFLKQLILHIFPDQNDHCASEIAQCLKKLDVVKIDDLRFVKEKDLPTHLSPKQAEKLTNALKEIGSNRSIFEENEQPVKLTKIKARRITEALKTMKESFRNDFSPPTTSDTGNQSQTPHIRVTSDSSDDANDDIGSKITIGKRPHNFPISNANTSFEYENDSYRFNYDTAMLLKDPEQMVVNHLDPETYEKQLSLSNSYDINWDESRALLINILKKRDNASIDSRRLKTILPQLGFKESNVILKEDITSEEILKCIEEEFLIKIATAQKDQEKKALALLYIGSHGGRDENNNDFFEDVNGKAVFYRDLIDLFKNSKYQDNLAGNPKVFWFQFCRKKVLLNQIPKNQEVSSDSSCYEMEDGKFKPQNIIELFKRNCKAAKFHPDQTDIGAELENIFVGCATIPGTAAWRVPERGAVFVCAIALIVCTHAHKDDLEELYKKVQLSMKKIKEESKLSFLNIAEDAFCNFHPWKLFFRPVTSTAKRCKKDTQ